MRKFVLTAAMGLLLAAAVAIAGIGGTPAAAEATESEATVRAPSGVFAEYFGDRGVLVSWDSAEVPPGHYLLVHRYHEAGPGPTYRGTSSPRHDQTGAPVAAWDEFPVAGATYRYEAHIYRKGGEGEMTLPVAKSLPFKYHVSIKPHSLRAQSGYRGGVFLRWTPGAHPKFTQQLVRRRAAGSSTWTTVATLSPGSYRYTDTTAESGTKYSYRVKAEKATGKGGQTNRVKFTAP